MTTKAATSSGGRRRMTRITEKFDIFIADETINNSLGFSPNLCSITGERMIVDTSVKYYYSRHGFGKNYGITNESVL